ncbi:MAG: hypothetical protein AB8G05_05345 [Oligoflexales bacterium]
MTEAPRIESPKDQRRLRNYLLQPLLQVKLGLYSIILALCFSSVIILIVYLNMKDFADIVVVLTEHESEIRELFFEYAAISQWWISFFVLGFLLSNIIISVTYTHKLVGPTIAFKNQLERLRSGDFSQKVSIRKGDAFMEIANELNLLTEILEENDGNIGKPESSQKK